MKFPGARAHGGSADGMVFRACATLRRARAGGAFPGRLCCQRGGPGRSHALSIRNKYLALQGLSRKVLL